MGQVYEFFARLFDTSDWPPRWMCGRWTDFHGWLYIFSDLAIWMAYFAIPIILIKFVTDKRDVPLPRIFWYFGAFILLCGLTHLVDASMFWWPAYRLNALVRLATACISWITVASLIKILPQAFKLKTSREFDAELRERKKVEKKLNEYAEELEVKNKDLEQFAYIASHDLQEPLRTVSNYVYAMKEDYASQLDEGANNYLNSIHRATERMSVLVRELLDFSQLGRNKILKMVDFNVVLEEVRADLENTIKTTGAAIRVDSMPSVLAYETEIRQLFQNLIANAIKFRKKDVRPEVRVLAEKSGEKWKFTVSDNGIGMAEEFLERIFLIFQRLHKKEEYEGTGIGLAYCKKIVELHHGKIWAESEPGKGTTIYFII
jgi:chemotaxis family two-component system sensor kinase Cph1